MDLRERMEMIYRDISLENIPWNLTEPPRLLVEAVEKGIVTPCPAVDLGCGAGNYAVWLARHGFDVTGLDISRQAIAYANDLAARKGASCRFVVADLLGDLTEFRAAFELAYDWEVLHHIFPDDRPRYVNNVHSLLKPGGTYLSLCFSEKDPSFGGREKFRTTPLGTVLYFSSEEELRDLFAPVFDILDLKTITIPGRHGSHMANAVWMKSKQSGGE